MLLESNVLLSNNFFHTNLVLFKVQTVIKSHSLVMGALNLAILIFPTCFFHSSFVIAHNFIKSRSCDGLAAMGLFCVKVGNNFLWCERHCHISANIIFCTVKNLMR